MSDRDHARVFTRRRALLVTAALVIPVVTGCLGAEGPDTGEDPNAAPPRDGDAQEAPAPTSAPGNAKEGGDPFLPDVGAPGLANDSTQGESDFPGPDTEPEPVNPAPPEVPVDVLTPAPQTYADEIAAAA